MNFTTEEVKRDSVLIQSNLKCCLLFCGGGHVLMIAIAILFATITVGLDTIELKASPNVNCDASYPDVCIASPPPDLDCDDISVKGFKVVPPDPHGFDREGDGIGCEADNSNAGSNNINNSPSLAPVNNVGKCKGSADCFSGKVTEVVDGDTLDVNNVRIRLSMVNTPERSEAGYGEATYFTGSPCPVGSNAFVDEDDGQKEGSYDRLIGVVYCGGSTASVNQLLLENDKAVVYEDFCNVSEFATDKWVTNFGC
jgi:endonuclease YncB( thermonuclease family)